jgi:hypothetical protein
MVSRAGCQPAIGRESRHVTSLPVGMKHWRATAGQPGEFVKTRFGAKIISMAVAIVLSAAAALIATLSILF